MALALDLTASKPDALRLIGTFGVAAGCASAPLLFALGLPWNGFGLYPQIEVPAIALHLAAATIAMGLSLLAFRRDDRATAAMLNTPVMILVALGLFSAATADLTLDTWLSIHGPGGSGIGALWHLDAAVLFAGYRYALQTRLRSSLAMILCATGVATLCSPAFPESLTLDRPLALGVATLSLIAGILAHQGLTTKSRDAEPGRRARAATVLMAVLGAATLAWSAAPLIEASRTSTEERAVLVDGTDVTVDLESGALGWLWSRSTDVRMAASAAYSEPLLLLVGRGFGSFADIHAPRARDVPGRLAPDNGDAASTYWTGHQSPQIRSATGNYLLSTGLLGLSLFLAFLASIAWSSRAGAVAAVLLGAAAALVAVPLVATPALMALLASVTPFKAEKVRARVGSGLLLGGLAASLLFAATIQAGFSRVLDEEAGFGFLLPVINLRTCAGVEARLASSRAANIALYDRLTQLVSRSSDPAAVAASKAANIGTLSCVMRRLAAERNDTLALITSLESRAILLAATPAVETPLRPDIERWGDDLDEALLRAPYRTDLAIPYIDRLVATDREKAFSEAERLGSTMFLRDPVREYLFSVRAAMKEDAETQAAHLERANALGLRDLIAPGTQQ